LALKDGLLDEEEDEEEKNNPLMPLTLDASFFDLNSEFDEAALFPEDDLQRQGKGNHYTLQDFRTFQKSMIHPGVSLGLASEKVPEKKKNEFTRLSEEVLGGFSELEAAIDDLASWKDNLLKESLSCQTKLDLILLFSKLLRR
jgi:hypothetical protein